MTRPLTVGEGQIWDQLRKIRTEATLVLALESEIEEMLLSGSWKQNQGRYGELIRQLQSKARATNNAAAGL